MTVATQSSAIQVRAGQGDFCTIQRNRTWEQFKHLQKGFEHTRGVKLFYYNGTIEILMPGELHELFKKIIAILIETFLLDRKIEFKPTGSMTQEKDRMAVAEANESYQIGDFNLSIEVNFTHGDASKLALYQALGVHEVWLWEDGVLNAYHLYPDGYQKVNHSLIPELAPIDLTIMAECILLGETSRVAAVEKFRATHPV
jgi:Uma2 family endonuclease